MTAHRWREPILDRFMTSGLDVAALFTLLVATTDEERAALKAYGPDMLAQVRADLAHELGLWRDGGVPQQVQRDFERASAALDLRERLLAQLVASVP